MLRGSLDDGVKVGTVITNENGEVTSDFLPSMGRYYLLEEKASEGKDETKKGEKEKEREEESKKEEDKKKEEIKKEEDKKEEEKKEEEEEDLPRLKYILEYSPDNQTPNV